MYVFEGLNQSEVKFPSRTGGSTQTHSCPVLATPAGTEIDRAVGLSIESIQGAFQFGCVRIKSEAKFDRLTGSRSVWVAGMQRRGCVACVEARSISRLRAHPRWKVDLEIGRLLRCSCCCPFRRSLVNWDGQHVPKHLFMGSGVRT